MKWTVELCYWIPVFKTEVVDARTAKDACAAALALDDWEDSEVCYDACGPTFVSGLRRGEHDDVYNGTQIKIPKQFQESANEAHH